MTVRYVSSRDFTRDVAQAKRVAESGPVFITVRGEPRYVLQTIGDYEKRVAHQEEQSLLDLMTSLPATPCIGFEPERLTMTLHPVDFG